MWGKWGSIDSLDDVVIFAESLVIADRILPRYPVDAQWGLLLVIAVRQSNLTMGQDVALHFRITRFLNHNVIIYQN